jgi:hypothetical protein
MKNAFNQDDVAEFIVRINRLTVDTKPKWGKMNVEQMLAHCNVTYEMVYDKIHPKPNAFKRFMLKLIIKNIVVNDKPYKSNSQTAPEFIIKDARKFELEKQRLIDYLLKTQQLGAKYFDGKESLSFGVLNQQEWNNMFVKHLEHHLSQFGV